MAQFKDSISEPLTINHIIIECQHLESARKKHNIGTNIRDALDLEIKNVERLIQFIKDIEMFKTI